jgi:hypothetical protein
VSDLNSDYDYYIKKEKQIEFLSDIINKFSGSHYIFECEHEIIKEYNKLRHEKMLLDMGRSLGMDMINLMNKVK